MQIFIIIFLLGFGIGGGISYEFTSDHYKAAIVSQVQEALEKQKKDLDLSFVAEKKALEEHHKQELKDNVIYKELPKYITKIQKVNSECNYSTGVVRLLNSSSNTGTEKATPGTDAEDARSSDITESTGIKYTADVIAQYNKWKILHNSLIDYLEKDK